MRFRGFLHKKKRAILLFGVLAVVLGGLFLTLRPEPTFAFTEAVEDALAAAANGVERAIKKVILTILNEAVATLGEFLTLVIDWLKDVAKYNGYRTQQQVADGWRIARDVINSFYIVVLIAIALSTIIRWKPLDFRTALRPLLISAVVVNFSRTICLFAISFSDVVMRTFLNQIEGAWPVFLLGLRAPALMALNQRTLGGLVQSNLDAPTLDFSSLVLSQLFAIFILGFSLFLMVAFLMILVFRIIALWVLIILSPVAFFLWGVKIPQAEKYYGEWKEEFTKQILVGPVFGFFLYIIVLFFAANAQTFVGGNSVDPALRAKGPYGISYTPTIGGQRPLPSLLSDPTVFLGYVVGVALMLVTLEVINKIGGRGVSQAFGLTKKGFNVGRSLARSAAGAAAGAAGYANDFLYSKGYSVKPSLALKALREGTAAKRAEFVRSGQQLRGEKVEELEAQGKGFRAALAAVSGGNAEFVKKTGLIGGESSLVKRLTGYGQLKGETKSLVDEADQLDSRQRAAKAAENLTDPVLRGVRLHDLPEEYTQRKAAFDRQKSLNGQHDALANTRSQLAQLTQEQSGLNPFDAGDQERYNQITQQISTLQQEEGTLASAVQGTSRVADEELAAQKAELDQFKSAQEVFFDDDGQMKKEFGDVADMSVQGAFQQLENKKEGEGQRLKQVESELRRRNNAVSAGTAGIRFDTRKAGKEYRDTAYEKDEKYSVDYIANNARSNANKDNIPQFMEDMIKAADQGAFDNVVGELTNGKGTFADDQGIEAMMKYFTEQVGMSQQQAFDLMSRVEGRNRADKKAVQTGTVKLGKRGKYERTSETERMNIIKRNVKSGLRDVLTKGGRDAIGAKRDGKYELHQAVKEALKEEAGALKKIIQDDRAATSFDSDTRKMLIENASDIGLDDQTLGILQQLDSQ